MIDNEYEKLMLNIELMGDHLKKRIGSFKALSIEKQEEAINATYMVKQTLAKKFSEKDRKDIGSKFYKSMKKACPSCYQDDLERETGIFLKMIEDWAFHALEISCEEKRFQDARKEDSNAFINAISRALDTMSALDDAALGYLLSAGFEQVESVRPNETIPIEFKGNTFAFMALANDLKSTHSDWLRTFHEGMSVALRKLPKVSKEMATPQFAIAALIEDYLGRLKVSFSTTETGLAGSVLHAVMTMADIEMGKAGYWLDKAKKHENSWCNFTARINKNETS